MGAIIKTKNLNKEYVVGKEKISVLKNVNIEINRGEFISIMGPSGSGKSTLLYLLGSLDKATSGQIFVEGRELSQMADNEESTYRRRRLGFVFQFYNLVPNLTVEENIMLPLMLDGKNTKHYKDRFTEIVEIVGLRNRIKHLPGELSGGQQQRCAIARALMHDPEIILADEPIGNLDSKTGKEIMELFSLINSQKSKTIVQVTHSSDSATYGNRMIYIKDGQVVNS